MSLVTIAIPILPDKRDQWERFVEELRGPRYDEFVASRQRLGVHERTFLQRTPQGDVVIVTLEGEDPVGAFQRFGASNDAFTDWFVQQVKEAHGIDLRQPPQGPMPQLVVDSEDGSAKG